MKVAESASTGDSTEDRFVATDRRKVYWCILFGWQRLKTHVGNQSPNKRSCRHTVAEPYLTSIDVLRICREKFQH
jgi:hypothetical protein